MISFRLSINDELVYGRIDWEYIQNWAHEIPNEPKRFPLRCHIYQCKELPASDDNGTSDPYIKVWSPFKPDSKEEKLMKTRTVEDNNNPIFYNTIETYFYSADFDWSPPVVLEIYDRDSGTFDSDDYIGRAVVFLSEAGHAVSRTEDLARPKWFPIKLGFTEGEAVMGQILASFTVLDPREHFRRTLDTIKLAPANGEYQITINVLGMRNLESPGILPVRKPFINFMLRSLLPPSRSQATTNITTQPSATGNNPTISTVVKFKIRLPNDPLYCPSLTCGVYDYIFKGISQPLIGNFVINIGSIQQQRIRDNADQKKKIQEIIKAVSSKISNAKELKAKLEGQKKEGIKEKEKEEEMKRNLKGKQELRQREGLAVQTSQNLMKNLAQKQKDYKPLQIDEEVDDIEMGTLQVSENTESIKIEESKQETNAESSSSMFNVLVNMHEESVDEEEYGAEKQSVQRMITEQNDKRQLLKQNRTIRMKKMFKQMKLVGKNVVYPLYEFDERLKIHREGITPPKEVFMSVGYDPKHDSQQKHYRRFYEDELENTEEVMPKSPFNSFPIMRGQSRGLSKGWFWNSQTDEAGSVSTVKDVGEFKAIVSVVNQDDEDELQMVKQTKVDILKGSLDTLSKALFDEPFSFDYSKLSSAEGKEMFAAKLQQMECENLQIARYFSTINYQEELARLMMIKTNCCVRVYVLDAEELPEKDVGGSCDPYIKLSLNDESFDERDNYTKDSHSCGIYKMYEFHSEFPGCGKLKIQMWDYDRVFGDDFIGETLVDLEDRFFSPEWQSIKNKPIEYRQLYHKSTKVSQGIVKCWIEIIPSETIDKYTLWKVMPRPPSEFEVRLVIWETKDVEMKDWEGTSDIYCRAYFDSNNKNKRTDIHYRSMDGKGSFNYRLLFNIKYPSNNHYLSLQIWDADAFSKNDYIGDASLNLVLPIEDAMMTNKSISLNKKYYESFLQDYMGETELEYHDNESFWLDMKDKNGVSNGKMRVQMDIVPKDQAEAYCVGEGRSDPNHSPFLPPPIGRIIWTLNPWTMLNQCVAPAVRNKVLCVICIIVCLLIFFLMLPNIMGEMAVAIIM